MEAVGFMPGPAVQANHGVSDLLNGSLLAYAVSSVAVVVDVKDMHLISILHAADNGAALTALCWFPDCYNRIKPGVHGEGHLQMATGDSHGRVLLWDVLSNTPRALVPEPQERRLSDGGTRMQGGIRGMVWVSSGLGLLAVAMHPGTVVLLDPVSGGQVWRREWPESISAMGRDPLDSSRLALCGEQGGVMVLHLIKPAAGRIESTQYRLGGAKEGWYPSGESSSPAVLSCMFAWTRELLFTMTQAQVAVFDMELHGLAASISLPSHMANFQQLLAILPQPSNEGSPYGDGRPAGLETLLCAHADGVISVWSCAGGTLLEYRLVAAHSSLPSPPKSLSGTALAVMSMSAGLWWGLRGHRGAAGPASELPLAVGTVPPRRGGRRGRQQRDSEAAASAQHQKQQLSEKQRQPEDGTLLPPSARESVLLCVVTTDGRVWTWDLPPEAALGSLSPPTGFISPEAATATAPLPCSLPRPRLLGLLSSLPRSVSTFTVCPTPVSVTGGPGGAAKATVALAVVTGPGLVDVVSLRPGLGGQLVPVVSLTLEAHRDIVRGLRWLGRTPRLVSFSCKKEKHGWHNNILFTDMRARKSVPFRDVGPEVSPMLAIRSSPSGRHLLILFRGAPSEIWVVGDSSAPQRVRVLDLPFTAVEWVLPSDAAHAPDTPSKWATWEAASPAASPAKAPPPQQQQQQQQREQQSPEKQGSSQKEEPEAEGSVPEEKLAFALGDGRMGVLSVKGRRIADTQPKRPGQGLLAGGGDCVGMALSAWGTTIVLGDKEGNIVRWDTSTGRSSSVATGMGAVRKVQVAPSGVLVPRAGAKPPSLSDPIARVAALFSSGQWGVWELDARNSIRPVAHSSSLGAEAHHHHHHHHHHHEGGSSGGSARITDLYWLPLPMPGGHGGVLAVAGEDASLSLVRVPEGLRVPSHGSFSTQGLAGALPSPGSSGTPASSAPSTPATARSVLEGAAFRAAFALEKDGDGGGLGSQFSALPPPPRPSTAALLPRPAMFFLRLMLQFGAPLHALKGHEGRRDDPRALERRLWDLFPRRILSRSSMFFQEASGALGEAQLSAREPEVEPLELPEPRAQDPGASSGAGCSAADVGPMQGRRVELLELIGALRALRGGELLEQAQAAAYEGTMLPGKGRETASAAAAAAAAAAVEEEEEGKDAEAEALLRAEALAARMMLVAEVAGDPAEAAFWEKIVPTLASLKDRTAEPGVSRSIATPEKMDDMDSELAAAPVAGGSDEASQPSPQDSSASAVSQGSPPRALEPELPGPSTRAPLLWSQESVITEAKQRAEWHEKLARGGAGSSSTSLSPDSLLAQQVLEYVMLGDFQTAVGFLLSSTPEQSSRYFRNALCTISLAAAASPGNASTSLHMQAAKVVAANAAAMGDTQLGVPLLCSVGLPAEAVTLLQDSGQWRHAATLAASQLSSAELSGALERWAMHVVAVEGCLWRGLGLFTAGGCCRTCIRVLKSHGYVDCAARYIELCNLLGAPLQDDSRDAIFTPSPSPTRGLGLDVSMETVDLDTTHQELEEYIHTSFASFAEFAAGLSSGSGLQQQQEHGIQPSL